jgi:iron complex outermembrane receptor protein
MHPFPSPVRVLAAVCALACALPAARAQVSSEPVVITGSARAQRLLDAPFAITAIDAAALRDAGPMINLSEALVAVPGLVVNNRNNYAQDLQISSRGFGARAPFGVRGLRLYTDGIPATMPDGQGQVAHFDLAGAQRVEVLRGPFSVLYGSNSGGVIALFSAPVRAGQSEVAVDAGSFGLRQGRVAVAAPLGALAGGALDIRASYADLTLDGFRPQSAADRQLANVRLGWQRGGDTVTLLLNHHAQDAQDPLGLERADFLADPRRTAAVATLYNTRKTIRQDQVGLNWRHQFADGGLLRESSLTLYDGSRSVTQWQSIPASAQANRRQGGGVIDFDRAYGGVEAKLALQAGPADMVVGVNLETQQDDRRGFENFKGTAAAPTELGVTGNPRRDEDNRATTREGFLQVQLPLAAAWTLTGGLRSGQVTMRTRDHYIVCNNGTRVASAAACPLLTAAGGNVDDSGALKFSYTNPVLGLRWQAAPTWVLHGSVARGYETPTLGELAYRPVADNAGGFNPDVKAQRSLQAELGSKWRGGGVAVDATVFAINTDDEIGVRENLNGRSVFRNVGRTQRRGAELAAAFSPLPGLKLQVSAAWLSAEYRDSIGSIVAGNRLPATQRTSGWAQAAWTPGWMPGEWALEWRGVGRTFANDANTPLATAPGHALAHLRWSGKFALGAADTLELLARVDNLFDRDHVGSVIVNDGNSRFFEPGAPRSLLLSARWQHRF